jgi:hypothetical protein
MNLVVEADLLPDVVVVAGELDAVHSEIGMP